MADAMQVAVITPKAHKADMFAEALIAPTTAGQVTILPGHAAFLATLEAGAIEIRGEGPPQTFFTAGGLLEVQHDRALLLLQSAERLEEIDVTRAEQELAAAQARLKQLSGPEHADHLKQTRRLHRAQARLEAVRRLNGG
jgi:F-type H+-transporting ATPase subunit epsilon